MLPQQKLSLKTCLTHRIKSLTHICTCRQIESHMCLPGGAGGGSLGGGPRGGGPGGRPGGGPGGGPGGRPGGGPGGRRRGIGPLKPPGIPGGLRNGGAPAETEFKELIFHKEQNTVHCKSETC